MSKYVAAIDQGTTSTRFMIFDHAGTVIAIDQKEHQQIFPKPGWVEHDPEEIWERTQEVMQGALTKSGISAQDIAAIGEHIGVVGRQSKRLVQLVQRLFVACEVEQRIAEIVQRPREARLERDGVFIAGDGIVPQLHFLEDAAAIVEGIGERGIERHGAVVTLERRLKPPLQSKRVAAIAVGLGVVGAKRNGAVERPNRLLAAIEIAQRQTEIVARLRRARRDLQGAAKLTLGFLVAAQLHKHRAQHVRRVEVRGVRAQHLAVQLCR